MEHLFAEQLNSQVSAYDWSQTPFGAVENWSPDLKSSVQILVNKLEGAKTSTNNLNSPKYNSQERYDTLFKSIDQGFNISEMLFDAEGRAVDYRFLEVNSLFEPMTGLTGVIGKTALELIPDLEDFWIETYGRVVLTGDSVRFEHEAKALNRWFEVKAFPIDAPQEFRFGVIFTDITDRKLAQERVKLTQERLEISLSAGDVVVWDLDLVTNQTWRSIEHDQIFGYEELLPEWNYGVFLSHVIEEDRAKVDLAFQTAIANGTPWEIECGIRTPQGEVRWIWIKALTQYDENGQPFRIYGVKRDISDRRRQELNNNFLAEIQNDLSLIGDIDQMMDVVSEKIRSWFGFSILAFIDTDTIADQARTFYSSTDSDIRRLFPTHALSDYFSPTHLRRLQSGKAVAINDVNNDLEIKDNGSAYQIYQARSLVSVPYLSDGRWKFLLVGARRQPSSWQQDELELMGELIPRIYLEIERSRSKAALEKVNQRFEAAMQAVDGITFEWSVDTNFVYRSNGLFNLIGVEAEDAPPTSDWWFNLIHPEDQPNIELFFTQIESDSNHYQFEYRVRHVDGRWIDVWEKGNLKRNGAGEIVQVIGFTSDISDRKYAERQLRNSERIYRAIGESIDYGIWINDTDGNNTYASQAFLDLVGINQAECSSLGWANFLHPDEQEATTAAWLECVRTENHWYNELRFLGTDQKYHHVLVCGNPVYSDQGEVICWAGIVLDVSRFKKTETDLRKSEERYRNLVELIPQIVWTSDHEGFPLDVNQRWLDFTGLTSLKEAQNQGLRPFLHPDDIEVMSDRWALAKQEGSPLEAESRIRRHDGIYRWYLHQALPVKNDQGEVIKWFGTGTDIETQKQLELEYTILLEKIKERNQELDQFSYIVSHDLKAPLRGISNLVTWLEEDLSDLIPPENKQQLQLMRSRVMRMEELIDGLLNYARISREDIPLNLVSVAELLEGVIDSLAPPPTFIIEISSPLPTYHTKRILLQQVLSNLISNAIKHHDRPDGKIKITVQDYPDFSKFTIADDGKGIEPLQQTRIFEIFQTLETQNSNQSSGIGLAIVKKIVESEGGKIQLISEIGQGSTFSFTWRKNSAPFEAV
jgi:PAS domain S-box-containing protein